MYKNIYCGNCSKKGHIYKHCNYPIMSMGIICIKCPYNINKMMNGLNKKNIYKRKGNYDCEIKYLMIRRKHSLGYSDFIRGKYMLENLQYLMKLIDLMTIKEKKMILEMDFPDLWKYLWECDRKHEYDDSIEKFTKLRTGFTNKGEKLTLLKLIERSTTSWLEPEWGFPKGRRNIREDNLSCAIREFSEETGLAKDDHEIIGLDPVNETFIGTNEVRYKFIYYISQTDKDPILDNNNEFQQAEIGNLGWFSYNECINMMRKHHIEKKKVLSKVNNTICYIIEYGLCKTIGS